MNIFVKLCETSKFKSHFPCLVKYLNHLIINCLKSFYNYVLFSFGSDFRKVDLRAITASL